jgi:hypothetical protein
MYVLTQEWNGWAVLAWSEVRTCGGGGSVPVTTVLHTHTHTHTHTHARTRAILSYEKMLRVSRNIVHTVWLQ